MQRYLEKHSNPFRHFHKKKQGNETKRKIWPLKYKRSIRDAISSNPKDFEDAVQIMACKKEKIDLIITRNKKDFKTDWAQTQTPQEFLASISEEEEDSHDSSQPDEEK